MTTHLHNHEPSTKRSLVIDIIRSSSKKKKATKQTHEKPNKIIRN